MESGVYATVKEVIDSEFVIHDVSYVPKHEDSRLSLGNVGLRFKATTLYIDMRGSTAVLNRHNRASMAKIYKCYFHVIVSVVERYQGHIRSFNGDGMLVFFLGTDQAAKNRAVKAALTIKHILTSKEAGIARKMDTYTSPDFGIGIDTGNILCTKIGIEGGENRDLVWVGNAVNKSVRIGDEQRSPYHVGISKTVYQGLESELKSTEAEATNPIIRLLYGTTTTEHWAEVDDELVYNGKDEIFYRSLDCEPVLS